MPLSPRDFTFGALLLMALVGCSDDEKGSDSGAATGAQPVEVCGSEVSCGASCERDDDCPGGQFCDGDACYAECTPDVGCDGTCSSDGRCSGMRQYVVEGPGGVGNDGPILVNDENTSSGGSSVLDECATSRDTGELTPVSMFVMMDNSLSMDDSNKWQNASEAMIAFFESPDSAGLRIALRFFGNQPVAGCDAEACGNNTISACASPQVDLGEVLASAGDAQESALVQAVNATQPDFAGTPMFAALSGATEWAIGRQSQNVDEQVVVLFVTDGVPQYQDCTEDIGEIAAVAANANDNGVLVYAIGLEGSQENQMDQIAAAGGTGSGIFIGSQNAEQELLEALNQIRGEVASCDLQVPQPTGNATLDIDRVNVTLTLSGEEATLGRVMTADECGDLAGWYYNDNTAPTRILLCPTSCDAVTADTSSRIDIVLGCEAEQNFPQLAR